jgi:hypothetical protein
MKRASPIRIAILIGLLVVVIAAVVVPRLCEPMGPLFVEQALARSDRVDVVVCVPSSGRQTTFSLSRPAEIQAIRCLIGARYCRRPSEFEIANASLPGCGGTMPDIHLVAWQGSFRQAELDVRGTWLSVKGVGFADGRHVLATDAAYRKLCSDAGINVPWDDYGL